MSDYEKIITCLMNQGNCLRMCNQEPNRVILGIEIVKILEVHSKYYIFEQKITDGRFLFMGLPVTVDYKDRWIMMVCAGNESDGRYWLNK